MLLVQYVLPRSVCCSESSFLAAPCKSQCFLSFFSHIFFLPSDLLSASSGVLGEHLGTASCIAQPSPAHLRPFFFFITSMHLWLFFNFPCSLLPYYRLQCNLQANITAPVRNRVMGHKIDGKQQSACHKGRLFNVLRSLTAVDSTQPSCRVNAT